MLYYELKIDKTYLPLGIPTSLFVSFSNQVVHRSKSTYITDHYPESEQGVCALNKISHFFA